MHQLTPRQFGDNHEKDFRTLLRDGGHLLLDRLRKRWGSVFESVALWRRLSLGFCFACGFALCFTRGA
jgi:hypothetical protein